MKKTLQSAGRLLAFEKTENQPQVNLIHLIQRERIFPSLFCLEERRNYVLALRTSG